MATVPFLRQFRKKTGKKETAQSSNSDRSATGLECQLFRAKTWRLRGAGLGKRALSKAGVFDVRRFLSHFVDASRCLPGAQELDSRAFVGLKYLTLGVSVRARQNRDANKAITFTSRLCQQRNGPFALAATQKAQDPSGVSNHRAKFDTPHFTCRNACVNIAQARYVFFHREIEN